MGAGSELSLIITHPVTFRCSLPIGPLRDVPDLRIARLERSFDRYCATNNKTEIHQDGVLRPCRVTSSSQSGRCGMPIRPKPRPVGVGRRRDWPAGRGARRMYIGVDSRNEEEVSAEQ